MDQPTRITGLDAMRGFTVAAMILVNFPGDEWIKAENLEMPTHCVGDGRCDYSGSRI